MHVHGGVEKCASGEERRLNNRAAVISGASPRVAWMVTDPDRRKVAHLHTIRRTIMQLPGACHPTFTF